MKLNICLAVALAGVWGWAEETPDEVPVVYPLYTVTTGEGTNYLASAMVEVVESEGAETVRKAFSELTPPTTGTFVKRGPGFLVSCTDMGGFTGEWWIQEGALMVDLPGEMGPKDSTAGDVHVANKASFGLAVVTKMTSQSMAIGNRFYVSGTGYLGLGALFNGSLASQVSTNMRAAFLNTIILEGDTMFRGWESDFGEKGSANDAGGYQLNGHTLTLQMDSGAYLTNDGMFTDGHIVLYGEWQPQSGLTFGGGTSNSLTLCSGSSWHGYHCGGIKQTSPWTLILKDGSKIAHSGNLATTLKNWSSTNYDDWDGPTFVEGLTTIANVSFTTNRAAYQAACNGPVSGPGGFKVTRGWLHFNNPTNTFSGPLSVNITSKNYYGGLGFFNKDAFPADNDTVITNKNGAIYVTKNETALPGIDCTIEGATFTNVAFFGAGSIVTKSFVKRGSGELKLEAPLFVDGRAELLEGTLSVDAPRSSVPTLYSSAPGLYESIEDNHVSEAFPAGRPTDWYINGENTPTNGVVSCPEKAEVTGWPKKYLVRYQGFIWNRSAEPVTWSFASTFATAGQLLIDDEVVVATAKKAATGSSYAEWYYLRTNNVTLATGPHKFDFRGYNDGYSSGGAKNARATWNDAAFKSYGAFTNETVKAWPSDFGLTYKEGLPTLIRTDYAIPKNGTFTGMVGGDGILFTLDERTPEECADEIVKIQKDLMRTNNVRTVFTNFLAAAGTVLNLQGSGVPLYVDDFEGSTCVKDGTFFICNSWTLSGDNVLPTDDTAILSTDSGKVKFGNNAAIRLKNGKAFRRLTRRTSGKLLDAGYEGSPALLLDPEDPTFGCWKLRTEDDGLYLDYESGTVLIVR